MSPHAAHEGEVLVPWIWIPGTSLAIVKFTHVVNLFRLCMEAKKHESDFYFFFYLQLTLDFFLSF